MMNVSNAPTRLATGLGFSLVLALAACTPFKMSTPPDGFVEVNSGDYLHRYKALDKVGMNVRAFNNHKGGTMTYWAGDLLEKLAQREYTKTGEGKVKSKNGVEGNRYDFDYTPPGRNDAGEAIPKFYTVALFVTKKYIVVIEMAGNAELADTYRQRVDAIAGELRVR